MKPWFARAPYQATGTADEQLGAGGYDRGRLAGVLITHSHWDHVSGLDHLQAPVWTNAGELRYAAEARDGKVFSVQRPAERPLLMRKLADVDRGQVRKGLLQVASLVGLMQVVPAHDVRAYDGIPRLSARPPIA